MQNLSGICCRSLASRIESHRANLRRSWQRSGAEMLGMLPQDLNPIELRTIGRQIVLIQRVLCSLALLLLHQVALVNSGIVEQDDVRNRLRLERNLFEKGDRIVACRRPLLCGPGQLTVMTRGSKRIYALLVRERLTARVWPTLP